MNNNLRISKLRDYLFNIINTLTENRKYQINANFLSKDINNYSLDKIPTQSTVERWIFGGGIYKDVYSFRCRKEYASSHIINLENMGFFEEFEKIIEENNKNNILPDIEGIESIECLNCGTLNNTQSNTAEFDIQIQITYRDE